MNFRLPRTTYRHAVEKLLLTLPGAEEWILIPLPSQSPSWPGASDSKPTFQALSS